ncbi:SH3 beta-barrel fold-containing protein [Bacteroides sp. 224]|uniref:SH3 beta-barrel fold-containing protein n=1 Tax=Bacteroides sp. 224 TaxID=2302936 RepID=UPI0013D29863|nr:SH3 beta-barrel fold-containing protein [Bacteroides sp. 224]NDV66428.1 hypothetical protein [Bacteroides sp. 224]
MRKRTIGDHNKRLRYHIMREKGYSETTALWMIERLKQLVDHLQYGHAVIAYRKQNGEFRLTTGTLIYYPNAFKCNYHFKRIQTTVVYWDVAEQGWRTFQVENFMEWRPVV